MNIIIQLPILIFSIILHEVAHGWVAEKCGDDTARVMGRITLNPMPHIDMFGSIILPALSLLTGAPLFGWAKPVPINPYRLNNPRWDMIWVSLAGPGSQFIVACLAALAMWFMRQGFLPLGTGLSSALYTLLYIILVVNIIIPIFNLLPIPPLDGSRVVMMLLPPHAAYQYGQLERYGFFIILALMMTGVLNRILGPLVTIVIGLLGGTTINL